MARLEDVKTIIGIEDNKQDKQLEKLIDLTEKRLLAFLPSEVTEVPKRLSFIVEEVAVKRYNRVGAEGMSSETLDGHSTKFQDDDFEEFMVFIERLYPSSDGSYSVGKATFY